MTLIRANVPNLMLAGLDEILFRPWEDSQPDSIIQAIFNMEGHGFKSKKYQTIKGYSLLVEKDEGGAYTAQDPAEAWWTQLDHIAYGVYSTITHEAQADERYGIIRQFPDAMREAAEATINYYGSRVLSQGFSALPAYQTSNRSTTEYLFDTHILKGGGTQANEPSNAVDLTMTSLWAAVNAFYEMVNESGLPWTKPPKNLVLPHQLQRKGIEYLDSPKMPEDANNAINALRIAHNIVPVVWPYWLGSVDSDAWYLLADKSNHKVKFVWREKPRTRMTVEDLTENLLYFIYERFSYGWVDYRGTYASPGA